MKGCLDTTPSDDTLLRCLRIFSLVSVRLLRSYVTGSNHFHVFGVNGIFFNSLIVSWRVLCKVFDGNRGKICNDLTTGPRTQLSAFKYVDAGLNGWR